VWAKDRWYSRDGSLGPNSTSATWSPISQNGSWCNPTQVDCSDSKQAVWKTLNGRRPEEPEPADEFANSNEQMTLLTGMSASRSTSTAPTTSPIRSA
jgi:iron complex outermembrane receptor protein